MGPDLDVLIISIKEDFGMCNKISNEDNEDNSDFLQLKKNTVKAENQLAKNQFVTFINPEGKGKRVLFVGNSITRHGVKHEIGWHNDWGMAASALEKDYVHIIAKEILPKDRDAAFCICQAAEWERNWYDGEKTFEFFRNASEFKADIIIVRLVENCPSDNYKSDLFLKEYGKLVSYLNGSGNAEIIITTGFWKHTADRAIRE